VQIIEYRNDILGSIITTGGRLAFPSIGERAMYEKCDEIEETIQFYRRIKRTFIDSRGLAGAKDALTRSNRPLRRPLRDPSTTHVSPAARRDGQIIRVHHMAQL
jgi:hypothetical protein